MVTQHQRQLKTSPEGNLSLKTGFISGGQSTPNRSSTRPDTPKYIHRGTSRQKNNNRQQKSYSERLEAKQNSKAKLVKLLKKSGEILLSDRVNLCSSKFRAITCGRHIVQRVPNYHCDFRLCPHCAARRSKKIIKKYLPRVESFLKVPGVRVEPVHLVLTQAHREGETIKQTRKRLLDSFRKLIKRKFWKTYFAGGIFAVETTVGNDGLNHVHLHILAFRRRFFDIAILRGEWKRVTGDSQNLWLGRVTDLKSGLREVVKYISKPLDIENFGVKQIKEFLDLRGQKMFGTFGEFGRFCADFEETDATDNETEAGGFCEGDACPVCDAPLFEIPFTAGDLVSFARRLEAVPRK